MAKDNGAPEAGQRRLSGPEVVERKGVAEQRAVQSP